MNTKLRPKLACRERSTKRRLEQSHAIVCSQPGFTAANSHDEPAQQGLELCKALVRAESLEGLRHAVGQHPLLLDPGLIAVYEQAVTEAPTDLRPVLEQRLSWLRQLAAERAGH